MTADRIRAQITVTGETKALALIISMLSPLSWSGAERILKTVCEHFGLRCERKQ